MRINVLSELPKEWEQQVRRWSKLNRWARRHPNGDEALPGRNDEYFLYQTLLGSWPNELLSADELDQGSLNAYRARVETCMIKAAREAKLRSSWASPNLEYEEALSKFVNQILESTRSAIFLSDFVSFARRVAWFGMLNSLSQTLLKLTIPGVPDIYQGAEFWDLNMVDPDNRRAVDFGLRQRSLEKLGPYLKATGKGDEIALEEMLRNWHDGRIKLFEICQLLRLRSIYPHLFCSGDYVPLEVRGDRIDALCAFARVHDGNVLIVVAPRCFVSLAPFGTPPLGEWWGDAAVVIPPELRSDMWKDVFTGVSREARASDAVDDIFVREMMTDLPVCALLSEKMTARKI